MTRTTMTLTTLRIAAGIAALACATGAASAEPAVVSATSLNLRAGPGAGQPLLAAMPRGARVEIQDCGPEWCRLRYRGLSGFAVAAHLDRGHGRDALASASVAAPAVAAWGEPAVEQDARVWRWSDPQWRDRHARQSQWLRRHGR